MSKKINLNTYYYKKSDIETFLANKANLVHVHGNITNDGKVGTTANKPLITGTNGVIQASNFGTTANTFCQGNDSRLSDARTPKSHTHTKAEISDFPTSMTPTSHTHGNITNAGAIGSTANLPVITTTSGKLTTGSFGTGANTFCQGNDSRLSDARTPKSHTHGNISNDGVISNAASKNVVTDANGKITTENKPTIPSANSTATNIKMDGTRSAGSLATFAKADHVHPTDSKVTTLTDRYNGQYIGGVATVNKPYLRLFNITSKQANSSSSHLIFEIIGNNNDRVYAKIRVDLRQDNNSTSNFTVTPLEVYGVNLSTLYFCFYKNGLNTSLDIFKKVEPYVNFYVRIYDDHLRDGTYTMYKPVVNDTESYTTLANASTSLYNASYTITQQGHNYNEVNNNLPKTNLIANSFQKNGGTSSEFLKADGSTDNTGTLLTSTEKTKLNGIETGATKNSASTGLSNSSGALSVKYGTSAGTACQGNDSRLSDSRTPIAHASTATTYGASSASNYGHSMASSTSPKAPGTANVGSETAKFARGDHVHPLQSSTTTTLSLANTQNMSGTVKCTESNGWGVVYFEDLKCTVTTTSYTPFATLPTPTKATIYQNFNIDETGTHSIIFRVRNNYLEGRVFGANKRMYGSIVYPIA